jgi:hypothetical protein
MAVFWVVAPCRLVRVYRRFRGLYRLHHQGDEASETLVNSYQSTRRYNPKDSHLQRLPFVNSTRTLFIFRTVFPFRTIKPFLDTVLTRTVTYVPLFLAILGSHLPTCPLSHLVAFISHCFLGSTDDLVMWAVLRLRNLDSHPPTVWTTHPVRRV